MSTDLELSDLDVKILRMADSSSPEQISEALGGVMSPARVRIKIEELLTATDWLSEAQQDRLVLWKMRKLLEKIENMLNADYDLDNMKLQLRALKEIGARLDKRRAAIEIDLETYDMNIARQLVQVYDTALAYIKGALRGDIDAARWDAAAREALAHAQEAVMSRAIES